MMEILQMFTQKGSDPGRIVSGKKGVIGHVRHICCFLTVLFVMQCFSFYAVAQTPVKVSGTVTDEKDLPLPGVTIKVKGATGSTFADNAGKYSISVPDGQATLIFTYIGFVLQEVPVNNNATLNVKLLPEYRSLNDVVVVGYGTQKKSDLTGAIVSLSEKDFKNYAVPNVSQLLQGKVAGAYVATSSGQPGDAAVVRIRGFGTVNDNNPLYVVDGQLFDNINNLNPNDIQNIEVLKDASATSIYGSRGSNGVILVTTKKAKKGESITTFDAYVGAKDSYRAPKMQNSEQFYNFITTAYANGGSTLDPKFKQQYERGFDTDWWKEINQTGLTQNYNLSVRNGGDKSRSFYSLGYLDDKGAIITTRFKRITLKINNEYDISKRITLGVNVGLAKFESRDAGSFPTFTGNSNDLPSLNFALQADPFTPVINPLVAPGSVDYDYNKYAPTEWAFNPNPVALLRLNDRSTQNLNVFGNVYGKLKLTNDLSYFVQYNFDNQNTTFKLFKPIYHSVFSEYNLANREDKYRDQTQLTNNSGKVQNNIIEQRLNYVKTAGKSSFDAMVAMTYESNSSEGINAYKTNAPGNDPAFQVLDAATLGAQATGNKFETAILSYLGRINYAYGDRYLATVNFRADGSSRFADGNKWGYFPSFSLGWRINNEAFFKNWGLDKTFSNLKLRGGWGQTGNQRINSNAPITLIGSNIERQWYFGNGYSQGYLPTNIGNPDVKWETAQQSNIGLDAGLFNERLTVSVDYFKKTTKDMLLQVPLPAIAGYPNYPYANAGDVENSGFETAINYRDNFGDVGFNIGGNLSFYKNKVTSLGNGGLPLYGSVSKTEVGGPMSRFFGYVYDGIFQNQQQIDSYVGPAGQKVQPLATPGDFKFKDLNNDGVLDDKDRTYIGSPHPDLIYGFNLGANYKGFDFTAFFQGTVGNDIWNGLKSFGAVGNQNALAEAYTGAWTKEGDNATYPKPSTTNNNNNYRNSSWWVESGSYLRLQNVQLGYSVSSVFLQRTKLLKSCRFYVSGQNLFTVTKYKGLDPEIGANNALNLGYDQIRYPSSRTILVGINAQF
jgi:TonB-linked SusC/RagA family outer membrane protein